MSRRPRDNQADYLRRVARGDARGLSRSQARGHPRAGERPIKAPPPARYDRRLESGLKALRQGKGLTSTAKTLRVSPERLRRYLSELPFVEKHQGRFVVGTDLRERWVQFYADGRLIKTIVAGYSHAVLAGAYWDAVHRGFLPTNEPDYLTPFIGARITDISGKTYTLETRPNVIYRLAAAAGETFEHVYKLVT